VALLSLARTDVVHTFSPTVAWPMKLFGSLSLWTSTSSSTLSFPLM
jgi:hypothetical protein